MVSRIPCILCLGLRPATSVRVTGLLGLHDNKISTINSQCFKSDWSIGSSGIVDPPLGMIPPRLTKWVVSSKLSNLSMLRMFQP